MLANILTDLTGWIDDISSYWWFPLVIFTIALLDSVIPVVPSETAVIAGGVAAGTGNQSLALVILAGAAGAFVGDNIAYTIGHSFKPRIRRWAARKEGRTERLDLTAGQIRERGGPLLITARFIPGGRTLLTVSCGLTGQPRRWFAFWIAIASVIWACYAALLGFAFGQAFETNHTTAFLLAFALALSITAVVEIVRWVRHRNDPGRTPAPTLTEHDRADSGS
jgi:membrane protein DedA with SNARE-associated domain